jgi:hypothetical protein
MPTQFTPILKLALPVEGELSGTWGNVVNDNITSMVEQAVAGMATINTWTANEHTLTTANGTTSESRCAILVAAAGSGGTQLTSTGTIICPPVSKIYVVRNTTNFFIGVVTTSGAPGQVVPPLGTAVLFCDGSNVYASNAVIGGIVSEDLLPAISGGTDIGSSIRRFNELWANDATLNDVNAVNVNATTKLEAPTVETQTIKHTNGTTAATISTSGFINVPVGIQIDGSGGIAAPLGIIAAAELGFMTIGDTGTSDYYAISVSSGKLTVFNSSNVKIMSIDSSGNLIAKGTITQNGTP